MVGRRGSLGSETNGEGHGDGGIKVRSSVSGKTRRADQFNLCQLTASTAHLRGLIHLHLGAADLAKEAFIEALSRDVKCFESFQVLVGSEMMSSSEGAFFSHSENACCADLVPRRVGLHPRPPLLRPDWR